MESKDNNQNNTGGVDTSLQAHWMAKSEQVTIEREKERNTRVIVETLKETYKYEHNEENFPSLREVLASGFRQLKAYDRTGAFMVLMEKDFLNVSEKALWELVNILSEIKQPGGNTFEEKDIRKEVGLFFEYFLRNKGEDVLPDGYCPGETAACLLKKILEMAMSKEISKEQNIREHFIHLFKVAASKNCQGVYIFKESYESYFRLIKDQLKRFNINPHYTEYEMEIAELIYVTLDFLNNFEECMSAFQEEKPIRKITKDTRRVISKFPSI